MEFEIVKRVENCGAKVAQVHPKHLEALQKNTY